MPTISLRRRLGHVWLAIRSRASVPAHVAVLRAVHPFREFVKVARRLHGDALRRNPGSAVPASRRPPSSIRQRVWKMGDCRSAAVIAQTRKWLRDGDRFGAVIGVMSVIGRDCNVGAHTAIQCALIGDKRPDPSRLQHRQTAMASSSSDRTAI